MSNTININGYKYYSKLKQILNLYKYREIVFFCVGNYKIWYDCFSSIVCHKLKELENNPFFIYGGKDYSITPENLQEFMTFVENKHPNACVIVVDNLLTFNIEESGQLIINNRSTSLAALSINQTFGNISILLKTYPYQNSYIFLKQQEKVVSNIVTVFDYLIKNSKIG